MAGGYLGLEASLGFPGQEAREKYGREVPGFQPNPIFESLFRQTMTALDPRVQRTRLRRQFGRYSDQLSRAQGGSLERLNQSLAQRGLGGSGIGAEATGSLYQNEAAQQAQLPGLYQEALQQRQMQARSEALNFLLQILQEQRAARGQSEQLAAIKRSRPTGFQQVLGDINGVIGTIAGLQGILGQSKGEGGIGGSGILGLL